MIGIVLLILALYTYAQRRIRHISIVLYLGFVLGMLGGFGFFPDEVTGVKNVDLALVYTLFVGFANKWRVSRCLANTFTYKMICAFLLFILISFFYSWLHYHISFISSLRGVRSYLLILSIFVFQYFTKEEMQKSLRVLFYITFISSILFILQIIVRHPLMPYPWDYSFDEATGLIRLYNSPPLLYFFFLASLVENNLIPKNLIWWARGVFLLALLCTLGRTQIGIGISGLLILLLLNGKVGKVFQFAVLFIIILLPFSDMIEQRFSGGGTKEDLARVTSKDYIDYKGGDGTFIYRIAWMYERMEYMKGRPWDENLFGLGLILEGDPQVYKMYDFIIGLKNSDGYTSQLSTPDIAYGEILTRLGYLGGILYIGIILSMMSFFFKCRNDSLLCKLSFCLLLMGMFMSFSGSTMAQPKNLSIYFLLLVLVLKYKYGSQSISRNSDI